MEFKKVTIRNYRIHKEQIVEFDKCLTLVGGENEKGKSTIAEAIHRALFFRAKGNSEQHKSMKSTLYPDDPEVELVFLIKGKEYKLIKKFGLKGGVTLSEQSMTTLNGDEAEAMLTSLIQTDTNIAGNNISKKWPLLWVWQGVSSDNPVTFIEESQQKLIQRLQTYGASTVLSSKFDKEVSDAFAKKYALIYNNNTTVKVGSALKKAEDELTDVKDRLERAREKVKSLEEASDNYEKYKVQLETNQKKYDALKQDEVTISKRLESIKDLEASKKLQDSNFQAKQTTLTQLKGVKEEILTLEKKILDLTGKLDPSKAVLNKKKDELLNITESIKDLGNQLVDLKKEEDVYKNTIEICKIVQELAAQNKVLTNLNETKQAADALIDQIRTQESLLNQLPVVNSSQIQELQKLEIEIGKAQSKLEAISTSFEVLTSKEDVLIDGKKQPIGTKSNFSEKFEINIGANTTILITPGGGDSLSDAKLRLQELKDSLQKQLSDLGFTNIEKLVICFRSREAHVSNIENLNKSLQILNAKDIDSQISDLSNEISIKNTFLVKKGESHSVEINKYNASNATNEISVNETKRDDVLSQIVNIDGKIAGYNTTINELNLEINKLQDEIAADDKNLSNNKTTLDYIVGKEGDKKNIEEKIQQNQELVKIEEEKLEKILSDLASLSPDTVEGDKDRITRSLEQAVINLDDTKDKLRDAELTLTSNGIENPSENLNKLEEKFIYINDSHYAALQKAKAIKKLHELFTQEQQQLADKLTKPLADKIKFYLEPIFGRSVSVTLNQEDGQFKEFLISRDGLGTFSFDTLSGGTKEQFSAAVRLAMAEVLSADFDDRLPIIFDDAFTNSDENRILKIQPMLDRASQKGVQVIVLTCHPDAYASLGATQVLLN
jgi:DNA repair exonuclease SbcCD ATPase subunit